MKSVWNETEKNRPALNGNLTVDVLIIGGGMCGILTAHALKKRGVHCAVVDAAKIGGGTTQNTTAKITAQHGLIYADLIEQFGLEKSLQYYNANTNAIKSYRRLSEILPCDFEEKKAYVYTTNNRPKLEREAEAYRKIGIPSHISENLPLPFKTGGAIVMESQAQFHPLKLLNAISDDLEIYENTFVTKVDGKTVFTRNGKITAEHIVLATHYPMVNIKGGYFLKLYQHQSYVMALKNAPLLDGMFLDEQKDGLSFRTYGELLLVGGGSHKTGTKGGGYADLEHSIKIMYPKASIKYRWSTQDCMSLDKVPYIGRHQSGSNNLFISTGFNKWGMSSSMVASNLLADLITTGHSEYEALYSPKRSILTKQLVINVGGAIKGLLSVGGPRCTHMGCKLHKNKDEKTWDCSCHGSRFGTSGHVITGPAKKRINI